MSCKNNVKLSRQIAACFCNSLDSLFFVAASQEPPYIGQLVISCFCLLFVVGDACHFALLVAWLIRIPIRKNMAMAASPLDWHSSPQRFPQNLLYPVIPSAPWRSPYDCSLPSLIGFDDEEMNPSLQKDPLLRWPGGAEYHR